VDVVVLLHRVDEVGAGISVDRLIRDRDLLDFLEPEGIVLFLLVVPSAHPVDVEGLVWYPDPAGLRAFEATGHREGGYRAFRRHLDDEQEQGLGFFMGEDRLLDLTRRGRCLVGEERRPP
jgi:hypothetical protein